MMRVGIGLDDSVVSKILLTIFYLNLELIMRPALVLSSLCWVLISAIAQGQFVPLRVLNGEVHRVALDIQAAMKDDPRLKGLKFNVGAFNGHGMLSDSNFGLCFEELFKQELAEFVDPKAELNLSGSYFIGISQNPVLNKQGFKVLLVTLQILKIDKKIKSFDFEINNSDQIMFVIGGTGKVNNDPKETFKDRNKRVQELIEKPAFDVKDNYFVTAQGVPELRMGITKKTKADDKDSSIIPENKQGFAYANIGDNDTYNIVLENHYEHDVVASLIIDGLDVANQFAVDMDSTGKKINWKGYHIPANSSFTVNGWINSVNKNLKVTDKVFNFNTKELGAKSSQPLKARGKLGVITVQFREAVDKDKNLVRSFDSTKGNALRANLDPIKLIISDNVLSTISIRYNR
jgi:hypothetical protein